MSGVKVGSVSTNQARTYISTDAGAIYVFDDERPGITVELNQQNAKRKGSRYGSSFAQFLCSFAKLEHQVTIPN